MKIDDSWMYVELCSQKKYWIEKAIYLPCHKLLIRATLGLIGWMGFIKENKRLFLMINRLGTLKELIKLKCQLNMLHWITFSWIPKRSNKKKHFVNYYEKYSKLFKSLLWFVFVFHFLLKSFIPSKKNTSGSLLKGRITCFVKLLCFYLFLFLLITTKDLNCALKQYIKMKIICSIESKDILTIENLSMFISLTLSLTLSVFK